MCIDLVGIALRIFGELNIERNSHARPSSNHFEIQTQDMIDSSRWKPISVVRELRGKVLKKSDGSSLTDVDAIGCYEGTLLLVSCKSKINSPRHDATLFKENRNNQSEVRRSLLEHDKLVEYVAKNREGPNYDFRHFKRIIGVVCVPSPMWIGSGTHDQNSDGLYRCCSFGELGRWLAGVETTPILKAFGRIPDGGADGVPPKGLE